MRFAYMLSLLAIVAACDDDPVHHLSDAPPVLPDIAGDQPPVASLVGPSNRLAMVGRAVTLAGTATDPDGDPLTYEWVQTSGPTVGLANATTASTSFLARAAGTYTFQLLVRDATHTTAPINATVSIHDLDGGEDFSIGLKPNGTLLTWGDNTQGQLGDGTFVSRDTAGPVCDTNQTDCVAHPFRGVIAVATGRSHVIALKADGSVWAWGDDTTGQLGRNGDFATSASTPQPVCAVGATDCAANQLTGVVHVAAGYQFSVALEADGSVVSWGINSDGELGNGTFTWATTPTRVCAPGQVDPCTMFLADVVQLAAGGGGHTLAITGDGSLYGWGHNKNGQAGNGDSNVRYIQVPNQVCAPGAITPCTSFFTNAIAIDAWSGHSLALRADGSLWGWGSNDQGELGAVTPDLCVTNTICAQTPVQVCATVDSPCSTPMTNIASMAAGRKFSTAIDGDGNVWTWGDNSESQQGNGDTTPRSVPGKVCAPGATAPCTAFLDKVAVVATGSYHALALRTDGSLVAWGDNDSGQLGKNTLQVDAAVPIVVVGY